MGHDWSDSYAWSRNDRYGWARLTSVQVLPPHSDAWVVSGGLPNAYRLQEPLYCWR